MKITAISFNKHPETYINKSLKVPVTIERSGQPVAVMLSYERYVMLEDAYWGGLATAADKDEPLNINDSMNFLKNDND